MVVVALMQILLIEHHLNDIILIMVSIYQFYSFNWSLSSVNNSGKFIFIVYGVTLTSTYTDTANDTTNFTLLCTPSLSTTTGSINITNTSTFQYIVLICYPFE